MSIALSVSLVVALLGDAPPAADPLPAPLPQGLALHHKLCEIYVTGEEAGKARSLICDLAGRPAILIYAREIDPALVTLLRKLDAVAQLAKEEKMRSSCVLLIKSDDDRAALRPLMEREKLNATILAFVPIQDHGYYFGSNPTRHGLPSDAVVTVIVLHKLKVQSSYAFRKGELKDAHIATIVKDANKLLTAENPKRP